MKSPLRCVLAGAAYAVLLSPGFSHVPEAVKTAKVLDSQEVDLGDHKITYNRIEAPNLKPEPAKVAAAPVEAVPMTAQEEADLKAWEAKLQYSFYPSVTVYDGNFSEIRWWDEGHENVVWSNVNFLHFCALADLETETAYYSFMLWGWETTSEEMRAMNAEAKSPEELVPLPPSGLPALGKEGPQWVAAGKLSEGAVQAMEDFHEYYQANGAKMAAEYQRREEEAKAQEEWLKANPPIPPDTIVSFFPIRSVHAPKTLPVEKKKRK